MESPDTRHIVMNVAYRREAVGGVGDEQTHSGDICINETEMILIAKLDQSLCLSGVVPGCVRVEGMEARC